MQHEKERPAQEWQQRVQNIDGEEKIRYLTQTKAAIERQLREETQKQKERRQKGIYTHITHLNLNNRGRYHWPDNFPTVIQRIDSMANVLGSGFNSNSNANR